MGIKAFKMDLAEGQEWTDELSVTLTRLHWAQVMALLASQSITLGVKMTQVQESAADGDFAAMLMVGPMEHNFREIADTLIEVAKVVDPTMHADLAEAMRKDIEQAKADLDA